MKDSNYRDGNGSSQREYLEEVILQLSGIHGKIPLDGPEGFKAITIDGTVRDLSEGSAIPANAGSATIMIEASAGVTLTDRCVRFTENDQAPTVAVGFFLGDADIYEVSGDALNNISFISGDPGQTSTLFVQFHQDTTTDD